MRSSLFLIFLTLQSVQSWRSFILYFTNITCNRKSDILSYLNCSVIELNRFKNALSLYTETSQELTRIGVDFSLTCPRKGLDDFVVLNVSKVDGCEFLEAKLGFNLLQIIRNDLNKYANFPKKCPVPKRTKVSIIKYRFSTENMPPYMQDHNFHVRIVLWSDLRPFIEVIIDGAVEQKRKRKGTKQLNFNKTT